MDKTAIVILNYNGVEHLKRFLPIVVEYSHDYTIVVIDNHSEDDSVAYLKRHHPGIQLICLNKNYGFSGGYNRGLSQLAADNFVLLNSDVQVTPGWIETLCHYMLKHPEIAICQPKILSLTKENHFDYAGAAGGFIDRLGYPFCRGRVFNYLEKDQGQYDDDRTIFWAGGACLFIRSEVFRQLEGFDEDFFAHMEEIDLCWRSHRIGYLTGYVGESIVYHLGGGTLKDTNPFKTYLNFRNGLQLLLKNSPIGVLCWKIPLRMGLDLVAALRFLLLGSSAHFLAVLKAEVMFLRMFRSTWIKRNRFKAPYKSELTGIWLIWEYFIRGKRTYSAMVNSH